MKGSTALLPLSLANRPFRFHLLMLLSVVFLSRPRLPLRVWRLGPGLLPARPAAAARLPPAPQLRPVVQPTATLRLVQPYPARQPAVVLAAHLPS